MGELSYACHVYFSTNVIVSLFSFVFAVVLAFNTIDNQVLVFRRDGNLACEYLYCIHTNEYQGFSIDENFLSNEDIFFVFHVWRYQGCFAYFILS